jgi:DNA-binding NtrC family response regulator
MKPLKPEPASQRNERLLVIDDDRRLGDALQLLLQREGYRVVYAETADDGVQRGLAGDFDLVITDLRLGQGSGLEVIRTLKDAHEELPIILMTSYSSVQSAVQALRNGAVDYIIKPFNNDEFIYAVERALNEKRLRRENAVLKRNLKKAYENKKIIGESAGIKRVHDLIRRVAPSDATVLIHGESGTGKELVAQAIHYQSNRADGPFVAVNCGAIQADLIESELFGHEKGAFTGASSSAEGMIQEAHGGTLFLDEIGELTMSLQVKLLRVIQEKEVRPVGGKGVRRVDVRFVTATNKDLKKAVEQGEFREDLFYRLNVITVQVPPLRERTGDIERLAQHFVDYYSKKIGKRIQHVGDDFKTFLIRYQWPGNVRELQNVIERAVILSDSDVLTCADLPEVVPTLPKSAASFDLSEHPLSVEDYIQYVALHYQHTHSEVEIARMLGIGRKALWSRRHRWGMMRVQSTAMKQHHG